MRRSFLAVAALAGTMQVTTIIEREGGEYVFVCRELDIASQGPTVEKARDNLQEVIELFFETADPSEIAIRPGEVCVTRLEIAVGWFRVFSARELCRLPGDHGFELVGSGRPKAACCWPELGVDGTRDSLNNVAPAGACA